ncbi:MAG: TRAP transporter small permease subunit [Pseudomonadota bacterium]
MAGASAVLEDSSLLSRLDRGLLKFERFFALLGGLAVFSLMFLAVRSVGGREFFEAPLPGYTNWIEAMMPIIAILGVSYVQRDGTHIRMDILIGQLRGRALWAVETFLIALMLLLMIALTIGAFDFFDRAFDCSRPLCSRDSFDDINMPTWPYKLVVPIAFGLLCLRLALQLVGYARAFWLNLDRPVAVPLMQSVEQQARAEADQLGGRE